MGKFVGRPVRRLEDPRLIQGEGQYVDDLTLAGAAHAFVLRSPHAHARLSPLDVSRAARQPGVFLVLTGRDLRGTVKPKPLLVHPPGLRVPAHPPLAHERVTYVGQPVALVVATDRALAQDAAELIHTDYERLPAVTDPEAALMPGAPALHPEFPDNVILEHSWQSGDLDRAFAEAHRVIRGRFVNPRVAAAPMEPRGCLALFQSGQLTLWISTQMAHAVRSALAQALDLPEHRLRVVAPEVGGGFGAKTGIYDEEILVPLAAMRVGRPVKWIESRSEHLMATTQGRGQLHEAEMALSRDGSVLGLRVSGVADIGAYPEATSANPPMLCGRLITGAYRIPAASYRVRGAFTNKMPTGVYRGTGRPEALFMIERMMDLAATELGLDPVEIRRKNFVEAFPSRNPAGLTYDSGQYALALDKALGLLGYERFRQEQARLRREGRYVGVGIATYVERASLGPSKLMAFPAYEYGAVRVEPGGQVTVLTGTSPHGQGSWTTFAQIVADELGVRPEDVTVLHGDTAVIPMGFGTAGGRGASVGGSAVYLAARRVVDKATRLSAHLLEAAPEDIVFEGGRVHVRGAPSRAVTLREVAKTAHRGANLPPGMEPGLEASHVFDPPDFTMPFGTHIAVVEVLPETGEVTLLRFIAVDDVGTILNPLLLEGQIHGGVAQGIGQALWEEVVYDEAGQLLSANFMEYAIPRADGLLAFELESTVTPSPMNPLGAKGAGEAGCVGAPPALVGAVVDALAPFGVRHLDMPLRPEKIWRAIQDATRRH